MVVQEIERSFLEKLLRWGIRQIKNLISKIKNFFLIICIKKHNRFLAKCLLLSNADIDCVDSQGRTLLHIVMSDLKLDKGKDIQQVKKEKIRMMKFLVDQGFDINKTSQIKGKDGEIIVMTALQYACCRYFII